MLEKFQLSEKFSLDLVKYSFQILFKWGFLRFHNNLFVIAVFFFSYLPSTFWN